MEFWDCITCDDNSNIKVLPPFSVKNYDVIKCDIGCSNINSLEDMLLVSATNIGLKTDNIEEAFQYLYPFYKYTEVEECLYYFAKRVKCINMDYGVFKKCLNMKLDIEMWSLFSMPKRKLTFEECVLLIEANRESKFDNDIIYNYSYESYMTPYLIEAVKAGANVSDIEDLVLGLCKLKDLCKKYKLNEGDDYCDVVLRNICNNYRVEYLPIDKLYTAKICSAYALGRISEMDVILLYLVDDNSKLRSLANKSINKISNLIGELFNVDGSVDKILIHDDRVVCYNLYGIINHICMIEKITDGKKIRYNNNTITIGDFSNTEVENIKTGDCSLSIAFNKRDKGLTNRKDTLRYMSVDLLSGKSDTVLNKLLEMENINYSALEFGILRLYKIKEYIRSYKGIAIAINSFSRCNFWLDSISANMLPMLLGEILTIIYKDSISDVRYNTVAGMTEKPYLILQLFDRRFRFSCVEEFLANIGFVIVKNDCKIKLEIETNENITITIGTM